MFDFFKKKKKDDEIRKEDEKAELSEDEVIESDIEEDNEDTSKMLDESLDGVEDNLQEDNNTIKELEDISSVDDKNKNTDENVGFFSKIKNGLTKTRDSFTSNLKNLFTRNVKIDDDLYDELEEILISADIGMTSTVEIVDQLRDEIKKEILKIQKKYILF